MSASTELHTHPGSPPEPHHQTHEHDHPSDRKYVWIALILGILTAAEVSTYFMEDVDQAVLVPALLVMMVVKFAIVCLYFMHLKFDNPLFRRVFVFGLLLAVAVYTVALTTLNFWEGS